MARRFKKRPYGPYRQARALSGKRGKTFRRGNKLVRHVYRGSRKIGTEVVKHIGHGAKRYVRNRSYRYFNKRFG